MSDPKPQKKARAPRAFGWMAEYKDEHELLAAACKVRDSGYTRTDAFTPFPVHGIDEALGIKPTILPWFPLVAGVAGTVTALTMEYWMNAVSYAYIISGKPYASWPAFIPVTFELTVLFAAFTAVIAMLALNGLLRFSNPVFTNPKFDRSTDDRFFLWVDSRDKYFNSDKVKGLLAETGPLSVEEVREDDSSDRIPRPLITVIATLILITLIPGAIVLNMRAAKSGQPRLHVFFDMDFQPYRATQSRTTIFDDRRVQRPPVPGTIARGDLEYADSYYLGYDPDEEVAQLDAPPDWQLVSYLQQREGQLNPPVEGTPPTPQDSGSDGAGTDDSEPGGDPGGDSTQPPAEQPAKSGDEPASSENEFTEQQAAESDEQANEVEQATGDQGDPSQATGEDEVQRAWITKFPLPVDDKLYELGKQKFEQNCSVCHGYAGYGDGLVHQRAAALAQGYWLQPSSLHEERIQEQPVGQIYYTITNGKGKMGGYEASITPEERWAIVLYVRALQRSQNARPSDVPEGALADSTTQSAGGSE